MQKISAVCLLAVITCLVTGKSTQAQEEYKWQWGESNQSDVGTVFSPNAFKVPYLGVDGAFNIDTKEISATDPRNPKRVVFKQMEFFSFFVPRFYLGTHFTLALPRGFKRRQTRPNFIPWQSQGTRDESQPKMASPDKR